MSNQKNIKYILLAAVVVLALVFFFINQSKKPSFNWNENYREDSREPYGTYIIYNLLEGHFKGKKFKSIKSSLATELPTKIKKTANYVFIGESIYLDSLDLETLIAFAENGNNVFISSKTIPEELMTDYLYSTATNCDDTYWENYSINKDTMATLSLYHPNLKIKEKTNFKYVRNFETKQYRWHYFDEMYFCDYEYEDFLGIGDMNGELVNFVKIPYGEGNFYLHTTPLAFTNYHLVEEYGLNYANKVFSHLSEGDIYWDAHNHVGEFSNSDDDLDNLFQPVSLSDKSPLQYILSQDSLRWAWYLLLALGLLYVAFRAKRRQRIIPVNEQNTNTSLEFIETIGRLYFQQNNHLKLSEQKMKLFLSFIRERYNFLTQNIDEQQMIRLSGVSNISKEKIEHIFQLNEKQSKQVEMTAEELIVFHQAIDYFYKNCK